MTIRLQEFQALEPTSTLIDRSRRIWEVTSVQKTRSGAKEVVVEDPSGRTRILRHTKLGQMPCIVDDRHNLVMELNDPSAQVAPKAN